ncbi:hypothetical protein HEK616_79350 (plasmid) [Streptomyces nigrescens]|uniref:SnoaL-like domain-containing protein n=1 Tax=Streptomyces nigrescens TaxID=1920 RepID=A0ABM8A714_STRNI|nr:hypothetical protein HEK616_79350 [Streptomyces nigrescens]
MNWTPHNAQRFTPHPGEEGDAHEHAPRRCREGRSSLLRRSGRRQGRDCPGQLRRGRNLVEWTSRATVKNGNPYDNRNIAVFVVHDGKITEAREYADTQHWEHALRTPQQR